jgi:thioredoxin 2
MTLDDRGILVSCPVCGRRNRLRYDVLDRRQRCGGCQRELPPPAGPVALDDDQLLPGLLDRSALPVLIDFWAPWCGPCRMLAPELKQVAQVLAGRVMVLKVNTDELPEAAARHGITSLPTLSLHWQRREVDRMMGARSARDIQKWLADRLTGVGASGTRGRH